MTEKNTGIPVILIVPIGSDNADDEQYAEHCVEDARKRGEVPMELELLCLEKAAALSRSSPQRRVKFSSLLRQRRSWIKKAQKVAIYSQRGLCPKSRSFLNLLREILPSDRFEIRGLSTEMPTCEI